MIINLFSSKVLFETLSFLYLYKENKLSTTEIIKGVGRNQANVLRSLDKMNQWGFLEKEKRGNQNFYLLNKNNIFYNALEKLFQVEQGEKDSSQNPLLTVVFEEHWISPLTQSANFKGWFDLRQDKTYFKSTLGDFMGIYQERFLKMAIDIESWNKCNFEINENISNPKYLQKNVEEFDSCRKEMQAKLRQASEMKIVDENYLGLIDKLHSLGGVLCKLGYIGVLTDFPENRLSKKMATIIEEKTKNIQTEKGVREIVNIMSAPEKISITYERELALLEIAKKILEEGVEEYSENVINKNFAEKIENYRLNYEWTDFGHFGPAEGDIKSVYDELVDIFKNMDLDSLNSRINEINSYAQEVRNKKEKIISEIAINKDELAIFVAASEISYIKGIRLELLNGLNFQLKKIVVHLAKKNNIEEKFLYYCNFEEIKNIFQNGMSEDFKKTLEEREVLCIYVDRDSRDFRGSDVDTGNSAKELIKERIKENKREISDIESFHGSVAYPGEVRGKVKIVNTPLEMGKVEVGDILVTTQTIPEMLPAMKRASAFVTDIGGITCHAAIVSREMKKPCIVGTKIGTKILRDGDMIQVDAYKGIVKIIKIK